METADQRLAVGFLGTGYIADWHAKALRSVRNARLAAVCDRDEVRVRAFAARNGINQVYTSLSAMLSDGRLDVIHVLLPPELHAQMAGEIIDAGIHVLLEKPMATCNEACSNLIERARSKGVTLGVSHNFLFAPVYEQLKADLKSGKLGRPDEITITWNKGVDQLQSGPFNCSPARSTSGCSASPRTLCLRSGHIRWARCSTLSVLWKSFVHARATH